MSVYPLYLHLLVLKSLKRLTTSTIYWCKPTVVVHPTTRSCSLFFWGCTFLCCRWNSPQCGPPIINWFINPINYSWLVVWNIFYFPIYWESQSQLTNSYFFRRVGLSHQPDSHLRIINQSYRSYVHQLSDFVATGAPHWTVETVSDSWDDPQEVHNFLGLKTSMIQ